MILIRHQNCKVQIAWQLQGSKPCSFTVEGTLGSIYFLIAMTALSINRSFSAKRRITLAYPMQMDKNQDKRIQWQPSRQLLCWIGVRHCLRRCPT